MSLEKEFIPYKQALTLKELGFDEPCFMFYEQETSSKYLQKGIDDEYWGNYSEPRDWNSMPNKPWKPFCQCISASLYQQAFRWFKEKHDLWSEIHVEDNVRFGEQKYYWNIFGKYISYEGNNWIRAIVDSNGVMSNTYEEAELACLNKLIEIVKNK